ncbi:MAG TPA: RNB domain-containing ribonuclease [Kofleriaceae bacterium]
MSYDMIDIAQRVLRTNGFDPEMPADLTVGLPEHDPVDGRRDLRELWWSSIDNEESRDLDQIEWADVLPDGRTRVLIGIADVDALVPRDSKIDRHAAVNTSTLYTGVAIFPMLPELLSVDRTSLLPRVDRLAVITEIVVNADGSLDDSGTKIYPALVRNYAKLVYESVGAWLEGHDSEKHDPSTEAQLRIQDAAAQKLRALRYQHGALDFETIEANPVTKDGKVIDLVVQHKNRARQLVEDLMIAANGATARYLERAGFSSIRRIVRAPKRWDRIVELAGEYQWKLPAEPNAKALADFMADRRAQDPQRFADLSLSIVKLLGPGEYVLQRATDPDQGHFGLAVDDYAHSTAPNRRYPDLITQRLLKAAAAKAPQPYTDEQLTELAAHCTERENAARKVERTMRKVAAAALLSDKIGQEFEAIVTGVNKSGTFARLLHPPAEGRVVDGERGLDVGEKIRVRLLDTEVQKGFIDFARI